MAPARAYLLFWIGLTVSLLGAVASFNLAVDPYGLFRLVHVEGFNVTKTRAGQRPELFKRRAVDGLRPNALILGNSRAEVGLDPAAAAWPANLRPVFNFALPGAGIDSALRDMEYVLGGAHPRLILVGLEFLDFRYDPNASATPSRVDRLQKVRDYIGALLTVDALADSIATIGGQRSAYPTSLSELGFNPMRDYEGIARREGYHAMFQQRELENAKAYAKGAKSTHGPDGIRAHEYSIVERMIAIAQDRKIAIRFIIYPYHAHTLVLFHKAGLWPAFEAWKEELVRIVDAASQDTDVELWDFSGFSPYSEESVPPRGDTRTEMQWYWEAGHFKKALGDMLLRRLFNEDAEASWGAKLDGRNISEYLQSQRAKRDAYERGKAADVGELARLVDNARAAKEVKSR